MIGHMSSAPGGPASGAPGRRLILRSGCLLLSAATAAVLTGCSIRLEDHAPSVPLLQPKSVPDEKLLIWGFHSATSLAQMAGRVPGAPALVTQLSGIHDAQATVLHDLLTRGGVPEHVIESATTTATSGTSSSSSRTPTAAVSAPPQATVQSLAAAEATALAPGSLSLVAGATTANRTLLTAIAAQRALAAGLLGSTVTWPAADPLPPAAAGGLLDATRPVAYAFEIITAQLGADARPVALDTLATLRARERELVTMAGTSAAPEPLGYALPFAVTTPGLARRLAGVVLPRLVERGLDPVAGLPAASSAVTTVVRLQAQAQSLAHQWGVPMVPFPGMAYP
jgi:hypothetical protein